MAPQSKDEKKDEKFAPEASPDPATSLRDYFAEGILMGVFASPTKRSDVPDMYFAQQVFRFTDGVLAVRAALPHGAGAEIELLDMYARAALIGIFSNPTRRTDVDSLDPLYHGRNAYAQAEAMLTVRDQTTPR